MNRLGLIGKKLGMTAIFSEDGTRIPVTVLQAGPCPVIQVKNLEKDGYTALQMGFDEQKEHRLTKPQKGHQARAGQGYYRVLREFRLPEEDMDYAQGQRLGADIFQIGERIKVSGKSKGRGFAGVIKRWNFHGQPSSHGHHKVHRSPGAIGQCADPARVFKGKKMPGQMGNKNVSVRNLEIVDVREDENLILVKGQVPGAKNSVLTISKQS
ncbi:MAG: 50S ribosomal protein L3 [Desulfohalobiaceae bacterium]